MKAGSAAVVSPDDAERPLYIRVMQLRLPVGDCPRVIAVSQARQNGIRAAAHTRGRSRSRPGPTFASLPVAISEDPMITYTIYLTALLLGAIAGLRTFTAPAAVSWAAYLGAISLQGTRLAFLGSWITTLIFTALALVELVVDQLPSTPSRKTPMQFGARIASGALCGSAVVMTEGSWAVGLAAGIVGAILGTLVGSGFRGRLAHTFRRDRPAAFLEDAVAIASAALIVGVLA